MGAGQPEPAGEPGDRPRPRELDQRQRVAVALRDDLIADGSVEPPAHVSQQQRACVVLVEAFEIQRRQPRQHVVSDARARRADERDPLREEASRHEPDDLRGGLIEPLGVVDDADEGMLLGDFGE